ncbi:MAG: hypothetical protein ACPGVO_08345, partial [Spirulinaceae cyanobacterium]
HRSIFTLWSAGYEGNHLRQEIVQLDDDLRLPISVERLLPGLEIGVSERKIAIEQGKRIQSLSSYLISLLNEAESCGESEFSTAVIRNAWSVWQSLNRYFYASGQYLEVPDACPGEDDDFMYSWSTGEHYLECELFGNGAVEFFYRNRRTNEVWGEDTIKDSRFSAAIFEKLALFVIQETCFASYP